MSSLSRDLPGGEAVSQADSQTASETDPEQADLVLQGRVAIGAALVGVAVTLAALAAFVWRLLPDVGYWDTGIFQAAPPVLGLTHPTGYPTYLLLGWAWTHLFPFGSAAFKLNLLTAIAGSLGVGMAYMLARRIGAGTLAAAAGALTLGTMATYWRTAVRADPHPLHVFLALAVVALLLAWDRRRDARFLVGAAFLFGLSMGNHALTAMLVPGIGVFVLTARPSLFRQPRAIVVAALALLAALAVYAYIPLRAAANPPIHYDYAPTTWPLFWRYVLGQDFAGGMGFLGAAGPGLAIRSFGDFAAHTAEALTAQVAIGLVWLGLLGLATLLQRRQWRIAWLLVATGGLTLYARLTYANGDLERYALFPIAVLAVLAALGAQSVWDQATGDEPVAERLPGDRPTTGRRILRQVPGALLAVPIILVVLNNGHVAVASARCFVDAVEAQVPTRAYIVSWWSMSTPIWYAQSVEGARPDIVVINADSTAPDEIARVWPEGRPIYLIELSGAIERVREAGYTLEADRFCGVDAWRVTAIPEGA